MEALIVTDKKGQKRFLEFRKSIYKNSPFFVDNNLFMIKEVFSKRTCFVENKYIYPVIIVDNNQVVCEGLVVYAKALPDYIQLCFFECQKGCKEAVSLLLDKTYELGKKHGAKRLVVGLNGHVNYGLGLLNSHFEDKNSFSSSANPKYYNEYFESLSMEKIYLNTYKLNDMDSKVKRYQAFINKVNKNYTFCYFDKKNFDYYSKLYTDLNNACFVNHRYYYPRTYKEDREMLKELFLFMKEDSIIFAFDGEKPVGFIMWYPDYNELSHAGAFFGVKEFFKNIFCGKKIKTAKVMEFGIIEEHRMMGLPMGLLYKVFECVKKRGIKTCETSWILADNIDSNSVCKGICDEEYKGYVVYERDIY